MMMKKQKWTMLKMRQEELGSKKDIGGVERKRDR